MGQAAVQETGSAAARIPAVRDTAGGTSVTAEIPAVPVGPSYGVLLPDGSVWYPGSKKKLPAPPLLRVIVWVIAFAVLIVAIGDVILRFQPAWTRTFRHVVAASSGYGTGNDHHNANGQQGTQTGSSSTGTTAPQNQSVFALSPQPSNLPPHETEYNVTLPHYTVTASSTARAWINGIWSQNGTEVNQQQYTLAAPGGTTTQSFVVPAGQQFQLEVAHAGVTVNVYYDLRQVATVGNPAVGLQYLLFVPARG
jgi:hypothetical protein